MTNDAECMTMLSVRVDDELAVRIDAWCAEHGAGRSDFVREALRRELNRRVSIEEAGWVADRPDEGATATEAFIAIEDCGPQED